MERIKKDKVIGKDLNGNRVELKVKDLIFRPSVYGILIEGSKILLSPQWDGYDFPGGGIDIDEKIDEALEREFYEETGLRVKRKEVIACEQSFFFAKWRKEKWNNIVIYYLCKKTGGKLSIKNFDEHEKQYAKLAEWIDITDIEKIKFYNPVDSVAIIKKAFEMKKKI